MNATKNQIYQKEISSGIYRATTKTSKYVIEYDRNKCIGAASCAAIAPLTFFMDEENKAQLFSEGNFDDDETIMAGAMSCPVFAIKIFEKGPDFIDIENLGENDIQIFPIE